MCEFYRNNFYKKHVRLEKNEESKRKKRILFITHQLKLWMN
jgi:hypothetical protein